MVVAVPIVMDQKSAKPSGAPASEAADLAKSELRPDDTDATTEARNGGHLKVVEADAKDKEPIATRSGKKRKLEDQHAENSNGHAEKISKRVTVAEEEVEESKDEEEEDSSPEPSPITTRQTRRSSRKAAAAVDSGDPAGNSSSGPGTPMNANESKSTKSKSGAKGTKSVQSIEDKERGPDAELAKRRAKERRKMRNAVRGKFAFENAPKRRPNIQTPTMKKEKVDFVSMVDVMNTRRNQDHCETCGEEGKLLCCATCTLSFHFICISPYVPEQDIPDDWQCTECLVKEGKGPQPQVETVSKPWQALITDVVEHNASGFELTRSMWIGLEDLLDARTNKTPSGVWNWFPEEELEDVATAAIIGTLRRDGKRSKECQICGLAANFQRHLIFCGKCGLYFHMDCLDPPLSVPQGPNWVCPYHAEHYEPSGRNDAQGRALSVKVAEMAREQTRLPDTRLEVKRQFLNKASSEAQAREAAAKATPEEIIAWLSGLDGLHREIRKNIIAVREDAARGEDAGVSVDQLVDNDDEPTEEEVAMLDEASLQQLALEALQQRRNPTNILEVVTELVKGEDITETAVSVAATEPQDDAPDAEDAIEVQDNNVDVVDEGKLADLKPMDETPVVKIYPQGWKIVAGDPMKDRIIELATERETHLSHGEQIRIDMEGSTDDEHALVLWDEDVGKYIVIDYTGGLLRSREQESEGLDMIQLAHGDEFFLGRQHYEFALSAENVV
eukprot:Clim_evm21s253 gene=Clim_evmTU21s253